MDFNMSNGAKRFLAIILIVSIVLTGVGFNTLAENVGSIIETVKSEKNDEENVTTKYAKVTTVEEKVEMSYTLGSAKSNDETSADTVDNDTSGDSTGALSNSAATSVGDDAYVGDDGDTVEKSSTDADSSSSSGDSANDIETDDTTAYITNDEPEEDETSKSAEIESESATSEVETSIEESESSSETTIESSSENSNNSSESQNSSDDSINNSSDNSKETESTSITNADSKIIEGAETSTSTFVASESEIVESEEIKNNEVVEIVASASEVDDFDIASFSEIDILISSASNSLFGSDLISLASVSEVSTVSVANTLLGGIGTATWTEIFYANAAEFVGSRNYIYVWKYPAGTPNNEYTLQTDSSYDFTLGSTYRYYYRRPDSKTIWENCYKDELGEQANYMITRQYYSYDTYSKGASTIEFQTGDTCKTSMGSYNPVSSAFCNWFNIFPCPSNYDIILLSDFCGHQKVGAFSVPVGEDILASDVIQNFLGEGYDFKAVATNTYRGGYNFNEYFRDDRGVIATAPSNDVALKKLYLGVEPIVNLTLKDSLDDTKETKMEVKCDIIYSYTSSGASATFKMPENPYNHESEDKYFYYWTNTQSYSTSGYFENDTYTFTFYGTDREYAYTFYAQFYTPPNEWYLTNPRGDNYANATDIVFQKGGSRPETYKSKWVAGYNTTNTNMAMYGFYDDTTKKNIIWMPGDEDKLYAGTNTSSLFYNMTSLATISNLSFLDTSRSTSMYQWFSGCSKLTYLDLTTFDTSKVTNMSYMFSSCTALNNLKIDSFDTSAVTSMYYMFYNCQNLTSLDLSNFNTANVINMSYMFSTCRKLTTLDLGSFDTFKVTNTSYMFYNCSTLKTIYVNAGWDKTNMTSSNYMFSGCSVIEGVKGTTYDSSIVTAVRANVDGLDGEEGYLTFIGTIITYDPNGGTYTRKLRQFIPLNMSANILGNVYNYRDESGAGILKGWNTSASGDGEDVPIGKATTSVAIDFTQRIYAEYKMMSYDYTLEKLSSVFNVYDSSISKYTRQYVSNVIFEKGTDMPSDYTERKEVGHVSTDSSIPLYAYYNKTTKTITVYMPTDEDKLYLTDFYYGGSIYDNIAYALFYDMQSLTTITNLHYLDTSKAKSMAYMFYNCYALTNVDLTSFDTSNVTNMQCMFYNCKSLSTIDLSSFNTKKVTSMYGMFYMYNYSGANNALSTIYAGENWDASSANCTYIFANVGTHLVGGQGTVWNSSYISSNTYAKIDGLDGTIGLLTYKGKMITYDLNGGVSGTRKTLTQLIPLGSSSVIVGDLYNYTNSEGVGVWESWNTLADGSGSTVAVGSATSSDTIDNRVKLYAQYKVVAYDYTIKYLSSQFSSSYTTSATKVVFEKGTEAPKTSTTVKKQKVGYVSTNSTIPLYAYYDTTTKTMTVHMPNSADKLFLTDEYTGISSYTTYALFYNMSALAEIENINYLNTSKAKSMAYMFCGCQKLTDLDLSSFDTSSVEYMQYMFCNCYELNSINLSNFNTSKVANMEYMFSNCQKLTDLNLGSFDTSNVTIMQYMFNNCYALMNVDLTSFDTSNVTTMQYMFYNCKSLSTIDLSSFNTKKVTSMYSMFYMYNYSGANNALSTIYVGENWDASSANCNYIFANVGTHLVGGQGTAWVSNNTTYYSSSTYAKIDGLDGTPGLLTYKGRMITYDVNGGTSGTGKTLTQLIPLGSSSNILGNLNNYVYSGNIGTWESWNTKSDGTGSTIVVGSATSSDAVVVDNTIRIYAKYKVTSFDYILEKLSSVFSSYRTSATKVVFEKGTVPPQVSTTIIKKEVGYVSTDSNIKLYAYYNSTTKTITVHLPSSDDKLILTDIYEGDTNYSTYALFIGMTALTTIENLNYLDTSKAKSMAYMFSNCSKLKNFDLTSFDTSNVTNMDYMFWCCYNIEILDLSSFDTSKVTRMYLSITHNGGSTNLKTIYVGDKWNLSSVTSSLESILCCYTGTNQYHSNLVGGNGTKMTSQNARQSALVKIDGLDGTPGFLTYKGRMITYDLNGGVSGTGTTLTQLIPLGSSSNILGNLKNYTYNYGVGIWDSWNTMADGSGSTIAVGSATSSDAVVVDNTIRIYAKYKIVPYEYTLEKLSSAFSSYRTYATKVVFEKGTEVPTTYTQRAQVGYVSTNSDIPLYAYYDNTTKTITVHMPSSEDKLVLADKNDGSTNYSTYALFYNMQSLTTIENLNYLDTSKAKSMAYMFYYCTALTSFDLTNFDTSNVTNMKYMFYNCKSLSTIDLSSFNTKKVTSMYGMFYMYNYSYTYNSLSTIYVGENWDASNADCGYIFGSVGTHLVGGQGTAWVDNTSYYYTNTYAKIDGLDGTPGLLTYKGKMITYDLNGGTSGTGKTLTQLIPLSSSSVIIGNLNDYVYEKGLGIWESWNTEGSGNGSTVAVGSATTSNAIDNTIKIYAKYKIASFDYTIEKLSSAFSSYRTNATKVVFEKGTEAPKESTTIIKQQVGCVSTNSDIPLYAYYDTTTKTLTVHMPTNDDKLIFTDAEDSITDYLTHALFYNMQSLTTIEHLEYLDTSKAIGMTYMFYNCQKLTNLDLTSFDTSKVTNMRYMFGNCIALESVDVTSFDTSKVTTMEYMFYNCNKLTELNLKTWSADNLVDVAYMFYSCSLLGKIYVNKDFDLSDTVGSCTNVFFDCYKLYGGNGTGPGSNYNSQRAYLCPDLGASCGAGLFTTETVKITYDTNKGQGTAISPNPVIIASGNDLVVATNDFKRSGYIANGWNTIKGSTASETHYDSGAKFIATMSMTLWAEWKEEVNTWIFTDGSPATAATKVVFSKGGEEPAGTRYTVGYASGSNATDKPLYAYYNSGTTTLTVHIPNVADSIYTAKNASELFFNMRYMTEIVGLEYLNTSETTDMSQMFFYCQALTKLDLSSFDTSKVTTFFNMFNYCTSLTELDVSSFDTSSATNMWNMFFRCKSLETIDVTSFDTSKVTDMRGMFFGCESIETLDLSSFDMRKVTYLGDMVAPETTKATKLKTVYVGDNWKFDSMTDTAESNFDKYMFYYSDECYHENLVGGNGTKLKDVYRSDDVHTSNIDGYNNGYSSTKGCVTYKGYMVTFDKNGGVGDMKQLLIPLSTSSKLTKNTFTRNGYTFSGWATVSNARSIDYTDEHNLYAAEINNKVKLYVNWEVGENIYFLEKVANADVIKDAKEVVEKVIIQKGGDEPELDAEVDPIEVGIASGNDVKLYGYLNGTTFTIWLPKEKDYIYLATDSSAMFKEMNNLTEIQNLALIDTSKTTNMHSMFAMKVDYATNPTEAKGKLTSLDLSNFNTKNVTDMGYMFDGNAALTELDLSSFDVSNVLDMSYMFHYNTSLTTLNLSTFDTSNVENMEFMFGANSNLSTLKLDGKFNTKNVKNMDAMFYGCSELNDIVGLTNFDTSKVEDMQMMFHKCMKLEKIDLSNFDTSSVVNFYKMFANANKLKTILVTDSWSLKNADLTDDMFDGCTALKGGQGTTVNDEVDGTYARIDDKINGAPGYLTYNGYVINFRATASYVEGSMTTQYIKIGSTSSINALGFIKKGYEFYEWFATASDTISRGATFTEDYVFTSTAVDNNIVLYVQFEPKSYEYTLVNLPGLDDTGRIDITTDDGKVRQWTSVIKFVKGGDAPSGANVTKYVVGTSSDADIKLYAYAIKKVGVNETYEMIIHLPSRNDTIYTKEDASRLFSDFYTLKNIDNLKILNTSRATSMWSLFTNCEELTEVDLSGFDTSKVTNMGCMFLYCSQLTSIDLTHFDTQSLKYMGFMFADCDSLTSIDISTFDTSEVTDMQSVFSNSGELESIKLSGIDTSIVTNMKDMFSDCPSLTSIEGLSGLNTNSATTMANMFKNCTSIESLDLTNFNVANVTNFESMFEGTSKIATLDLTSFDTTSATNTKNMFKNCEKLATIKVIKNIFSTATDSADMFSGCSKLVGGSGTTCDGSTNLTADYSYIDGMKVGGVYKKGYLTYDGFMITYISTDSEITTTMNQQFIRVGSTSNLTANAFTRVGYHFENWLAKKSTTIADGTTFENEVEFIANEIDNKIMLYAQIPANTYYIEFNKNDEAAVGTMDNQKLTYDKAASLSDVLYTKPNARFKGWSKTADGAVAFKDKANVLNLTTANNTGIRLFAVWNDEYTVSYDNNGGDGTLDSVIVEKGDKINLANNTFTKKGYYYTEGWNTSDDGSGTSYPSGYVNYEPTANITFYAEWKKYDGGEAVLTNIPNKQNIKTMKFIYDADNENIPDGTQVVLGTYDTSAERNLYGYESDGTLTIHIPKNANLYLPEVAEGMFKDMTALISIEGLDKLKTSRTTNMTSLFENCTNLTSLDLFSFDTSQVTTFEKMFMGSSKLMSIDMSNFETTLATNMSNMFNGCSAIGTIDLKTFDTSKVESMDKLFYNCSALTTIQIAGTWSTDALTNTDNSMFDGCQNLVGGSGTKYSEELVKDASYARVDLGEEQKGYLSGKTWTIKYLAGDASATGITKDTIVSQGSLALVRTNGFIKTGYHLKKWKDQNNVEYDENDRFTPDGNLTFTAIWEANTYTVYLDKNGGDGDDTSVTLTYDKIEDIDDPTYTKGVLSFIGWSKISNASNQNDILKFDTALNLTTEKDGTSRIYAVWGVVWNFDKGDATATGEMESQKFFEGAEDNINKITFKKQGYKLDYWLASNGEHYADGQRLVADESLTLTAKWRELNKYYITYDSNYDSKKNNVELVYEDEEYTIKNCGWSKPSSTFIGWRTDKYGSGDTYMPGSKIVADKSLSLYATWYKPANSKDNYDASNGPINNGGGANGNNTSGNNINGNNANGNSANGNAGINASGTDNVNGGEEAVDGSGMGAGTEDINMTIAKNLGVSNSTYMGYWEYHPMTNAWAFCITGIKDYGVLTVPSVKEKEKLLNEIMGFIKEGWYLLSDGKSTSRWYYFKDGAMQTGIAEACGNKYYLDVDPTHTSYGAMQFGWQLLLGQYYKFDIYGRLMIYGNTYDGYILDSTGKYVDSSFTLSNNNIITTTVNGKIEYLNYNSALVYLNPEWTNLEKLLTMQLSTNYNQNQSIITTLTTSTTFDLKTRMKEIMPTKMYTLGEFVSY